MGDVSNRELLTAPFALAGTMLLIALVTAGMAGIDSSMLVWPYLSSSLAVTLLCLLCSLFWWAVQLARQRSDAPLETLLAKVRGRLGLLSLPGVALPLFLVGYTTSKTAIPFLVGYGWDSFWADADVLIFGDDAWRITHDWLGSRSMPIWELAYTVGWGTVFFFASALIAIHAPRKHVAIYFTAMLSTWLIGGWLIAYLFSASGPVFAHLFDASLADRFDELRRVLAAHLSQDGAIRQTQGYLAAAVDEHVAVKGGGISAMPSMHLGAASIYVLAAWRTRWVVPACLFWIVIFVGSGYFGYHYWVDGLVAAVVAYGCWQAAMAFHGRRVPAMAGATIVAQT
jgi:hypothetical protein